MWMWVAAEKCRSQVVAWEMGETERKLLQIYLIELCHEIEQLTHLECEDYELYVRDDREFPLLKTIYSALIFPQSYDVCTLPTSGLLDISTHYMHIMASSSTTTTIIIMMMTMSCESWATDGTANGGMSWCKRFTHSYITHFHLADSTYKSSHDSSIRAT